MWHLKKKITKQNRNRLIDTENRLRVARGEGCQGAGGREGGAPMAVTHGHGDVKYSTGDIVRDTMWAPDLPEAHLVRYRNA